MSILLFLKFAFLKQLFQEGDYTSISKYCFLKQLLCEWVHTSIYKDCFFIAIASQGGPYQYF